VLRRGITAPSRSPAHRRSNAAGHADVFLLRGKIDFVAPNGERAGKMPFPNMIVIFGADEGVVGRMMKAFECAHIPQSKPLLRRR
jgi:hypothetical protein